MIRRIELALTEHKTSGARRRSGERRLAPADADISSTFHGYQRTNLEREHQRARVVRQHRKVLRVLGDGSSGSISGGLWQANCMIWH